MEKSRKHFTCVTHPPVQSSLALSGIPLEGFYPKGQGTAVETQQASLLWTFAGFATEDPRSPHQHQTQLMELLTAVSPLLCLPQG